MNGHNYGMWAQDMESLLKSKVLWSFTKTMIPNLKDDKHKFVIDGRKDEVLGVITTYIFREIHFHTSGNDYPNKLWKKIKNLFDKTDES